MGEGGRDPAAAWRRFKGGGGPLHDLTNRIAKAIFEHDHTSNWETACERDSWLAVGSWQAAEAVVAVLPLSVSS